MLQVERYSLVGFEGNMTSISVVDNPCNVFRDRRSFKIQGSTFWFGFSSTHVQLLACSFLLFLQGLELPCRVVFFLCHSWFLPPW